MKDNKENREQFFLKCPFCKAGMNGKRGKLLTGRVTIYQSTRGHTDQDAIVVTLRTRIREALVSILSGIPATVTVSYCGFPQSF
jgi:hypothetical protein